MKKYILIPVALCLILTSCITTTGPQAREKKFDKAGRVIQVSYYKNDRLKYTENLTYNGKSTKPSRIVYENAAGLETVPVREIDYYYSGSRVSSMHFYTYKNRKKVQEGQIKYSYRNGKLSQVKYYRRLKPSRRIFMFALQHYAYSGREIQNRRFIQYEINPDTLKPMQSCQHVVYYKDNSIESMRSSVLERDSKKIIEKKEKDVKLINQFIEEIEKDCTTTASGNGFIKF